MFSSDEKVILGIIIIVYSLFLVFVSLYFNRKTKTYDDYNVAGRSVSVFPLILTFVGTAIGGSTLLGFMGKGYLLGMGQLWMKVGTFIAGLILALFLLKQIRKIGQKHNMVTVGDYTALRYGEKARIPTVISMLVAYSAVTGMQFVGLATVFKLIFDINISMAIIIVWIFLTIKTCLGGLKSVIWQDTLHGTIQTIGVITLIIVVLIVSGGWGNVSEYANSINHGDRLSLFNIPTSEIFVYMLTIGAYQLLRQDLWQRIWAAKDIKTANRGYWASIIIALVIGLSTIVIGVIGRYGLRIENIDPQLIYYGIVDHVFPFSLVIVMIITVLATIISSADSFFISGATSIVNDIIRPRQKTFDDKKMLFYSRISVIIVSIISLLFALMIPKLIELWVTGTAMLVSGLLAPVVVGMYWKRVPNIAGVVSMWLGLVSAVLWQIMGHPFNIHPVFVGLPLSTIALFIITFSTKKYNTNENGNIEETS